MIHPTREDWMSYLYDELEAQPRRELEQHLAECPECRARLGEWRCTTRRLDTYDVPVPKRVRPLAQVRLRWIATAAAAAVVLCAGFALGRSTGVSRSELTELRGQFAALAKNYSNLQGDTALLAAATDQRFQFVQARQDHDYASLHKELETVAVLTEANFRHTENQLVQLASADTVNNPSPSPQ